jgi:regulator of replication initiation timing
MKKVELTFGNEVALVQVNEEGRVEVVREGMGTEVLNAKYDFETAVKKFEDNGWMAAALKKANDQKIPLHVQQETDEFLELHAQIAELNAKAEKLKKSVRNYMESNNKKEIEGTKGKKVYLQDANASNSTSLYSDYELGPIAAALNSNELLREVTEIRINSKKLDALLALDKLPKEKVAEIKGLKIVNPGTPRFTVKK